MKSISIEQVANGWIVRGQEESPIKFSNGGAARLPKPERIDRGFADAVEGRRHSPARANSSYTNQSRTVRFNPPRKGMRLVRCWMASVTSRGLLIFRKESC